MPSAVAAMVCAGCDVVLAAGGGESCAGCSTLVCDSCASCCQMCGVRVCQGCGSGCYACGDRVCDYCTNYCESCCDGAFCADCVSFCGFCDSYCCEDCGCSCDGGGDSRVHRYDYRPGCYRPKGNYPGEALLGVELEVGGGQDSIADVVDALDGREDHLFMKEDGSISGVEIVTHPMTLGWARTFPFAGLLGSLRAAGAYVTDGYGLHVHVSRNAFQRNGARSATRQMMWLLFIYRNVAGVETLARRRSDQWASFNKPEPGELARKAKSGPSGDNRYVAVNCNNARTFELRFFASTLQAGEFWAALEFADASVRYTSTFPACDVLRGRALTWPHFAEWVAQGDYPHLSAALSR